MNTVRSVGYGWAVLIAAGGGAYWYAKRSISADRETRKEMHRLAVLEQEQLRALEPRSLSGLARGGAGGAGGPGASESGQAPPSVTSSLQPEMARPDPATQAGPDREKSPYDPKEVFRSPKGDRLTGFGRS